jgi:cytochrome c oxidase subunit II
VRHRERPPGERVPRRGRLGRSGRLGVILGLLALAATGCSWSDLPRWGWPSGVSLQAERMLHLWVASCIAALIVGCIVWGLTFWVIIFHRKKGDQLPKQTKYNLPIELVYTAVPFVAVAVLFYFTAITENYVDKESKNPDVSVTVVAFKWNWQFRYDQERDVATGQPADTIGTSNQIPILVLPVDRSVLIKEHSDDVIHSFWVPELLFKRDVIPGLHNSFQINITKKGAFVGRCAELCGTYHSMMNFELRSVSPADYQTYVKVLSRFGPDNPRYDDRQAIALAAIGQPTQAVTTHPFPTDRTLRHAG